MSEIDDEWVSIDPNPALNDEWIHISFNPEPNDEWVSATLPDSAYPKVLLYQNGRVILMAWHEVYICPVGSTVRLSNKTIVRVGSNLYRLNPDVDAADALPLVKLKPYTELIRPDRERVTLEEETQAVLPDGYKINLGSDTRLYNVADCNDVVTMSELDGSCEATIVYQSDRPEKYWLYNLLGW